MTNNGTWQIQVSQERDGRPTGVGFIVSPKAALTCTHNLPDDDRVWIRRLGPSQVAKLCSATRCDPAWDRTTNPWFDVAVIHLPQGFSDDVATIGPLSRPAPGARLRTIGFPEGFGSTGQRSEVVVRGDDSSGLWLQVETVPGARGHVARGYSGAATIDQETDLVRGMVVWATGADQPGQSWIIPTDVLARAYPPLLRRAVPSYTAEPDYLRARRDLDASRYAESLSQFMGLLARYPNEPELYGFAALAVLTGVRPSNHHDPTIDSAEGLLRRGLAAKPDDAALMSLWALVKEDYFGGRGLNPGTPSLRFLITGLNRITPVEAADIVRHVRAPGSRVWAALKKRSES